ncbi:MAG: DUF1080 domain-containing protein [Bryobacterales bacterium]|nr:DUF1080 domain-containing protein [Bryobacterales bacterium]
MRMLWAGAVVCLAMEMRAAGTSAQDQAEVQGVLRQYVQAVNDCDVAGVRNATTDFAAMALGMGPVFTARLSAAPDVCGAAKSPMELTMLARVLRYATSDVVIVDAFFRTLQLAPADRAGRAYLTFVRRDGHWKLLNLRFHTLQFEPPYLGVEVAAHHDTPEADGWVTLFDGRSTDAFMDIGGGPFPSLWKIENGTLRALAAPYGRGLRTRDTYRSFELRFEWKTPVAGNSGVKYRLFYLMDSKISDGAGYEYQVVDDTGDLGAIRSPLERVGALYNQIAPAGSRPRPVEEWNESTLIVRGRHAEHWLNGTKVMEYDSESGPPEGPILLQHHGSDFWYRNIRIKRLD